MNDVQNRSPWAAKTAEDVRRSVRGFVLSNFYVPDSDLLGDDTSLLESGVVDSTGVLEVLAFLEKEFGLRVEDSEVTSGNLDSIGRLTAFVGRKLGDGLG
jgi:acyl carrier protein